MQPRGRFRASWIVGRPERKVVSQSVSSSGACRSRAGRFNRWDDTIPLDPRILRSVSAAGGHDVSSGQLCAPVHAANEARALLLVVGAVPERLRGPAYRILARARVSAKANMPRRVSGRLGSDYAIYVRIFTVIDSGRQGQRPKCAERRFLKPLNQETCCKSGSKPVFRPIRRLNQNFIADFGSSGRS